jgi:hypothetical protein
LNLLHIDIELAPNLATIWGVWQQNVHPNQMLETSRILCYAAQWEGKEKILFDSERKTPDRKEFLKRLWDLLNKADAVCHYNGDRFDIKIINTEFVEHEMGPPSPYHSIDLLKEVRRNFRFLWNKLDFVAGELKIGRKLPHEGHQLWLDCMDGEARAWKTMKEYNIHDVEITVGLYHRILPWIKNHPNIALHGDMDEKVCPKCGSHHIQNRGWAYTKTQRYRRYQCQTCESWFRGRYTTLCKEAKDNVLTQ